jgi:hypothetical protein
MKTVNITVKKKTLLEAQIEPPIAQARRKVGGHQLPQFGRPHGQALHEGRKHGG